VEASYVAWLSSKGTLPRAAFAAHDLVTQSEDLQLQKGRRGKEKKRAAKPETNRLDIGMSACQRNLANIEGFNEK
jgi:hypothetical protein